MMSKSCRRMRLNEREAAQMIDGIDLDNPWLMGLHDASRLGRQTAA